MSAGLTAWVFPGQGSQEPGMGRDLYDSSAAARALFDQADGILGRGLSQICFEGAADAVNDTANAQPAIYVMSLACLAAAKEADALTGKAAFANAAFANPSFVAGHSLGEYSALAAAGALDFDEGLRLVETRGRLTQSAAESTPGRMAAVLGLEAPAVAAVCEETGAELCNINAPGQIVIGGRSEAVNQACALALKRGAKRAIPLDVTGAFHTSLMQPAAAPMREAVAVSGLRAPRIPFVANDRAAAITDAEEIANELVHQLTHPVQWVRCVEYMAQHGVTEFVEFGPGRVLSGLIKRIVPGARTQNINKAPLVRT